jgi:hypothetical protein
MFYTENYNLYKGIYLDDLNIFKINKIVLNEIYTLNMTIKYIL